MIHRVTIQNYKNLRDQTIDLDRLTVFVGANGSGKTSVLEAIDLAVGAEPDGPGSRDRRNQECGWIYTRGGSGALAVTCETEGGRFTFRVSPLEHFLPSPEPLGTPRWKFELTADDGNSAVVVRETARPLAFLRLNAAQLAEASYTEIDPPRLESDGGGLASVLAFMALNDPDAFGALVDQVRQLLPQIKRI